MKYFSRYDNTLAGWSKRFNPFENDETVGSKCYSIEVLFDTLNGGLLYARPGALSEVCLRATKIWVLGLDLYPCLPVREG